MWLSGRFLLRVPPSLVNCHHILILSRCSSGHNSSHHSHNRTFYETLGLETTASRREIRSAFLTLSKKHHPDIDKRDDAHKHFMEINEAYNVLHNPASRYQYDMRLYTMKPGAVYGHPRPPNVASENYQFYENYRNLSEQQWAKMYQDSMPKRNHAPLILFLVGLMVVGTVGHSVRIHSSHRQYQRAADEESRKNTMIYNNVREQAANSTVPEQLERLAQRVRQEQNK